MSPRDPSPTQPCPLCGRLCPRDMMQRHHLQTRKFDKHDIQRICSDCHKMVHALFSNREVAKELNTIEALLNNEEFQRFLVFVRKRPPGSRTRARRSRTLRRR